MGDPSTLQIVIMQVTTVLDVSELLGGTTAVSDLTLMDRTMILFKHIGLVGTMGHGISTSQKSR